MGSLVVPGPLYHQPSLFLLLLLTTPNMTTRDASPPASAFMPRPKLPRISSTLVPSYFPPPLFVYVIDPAHSIMVAETGEVLIRLALIPYLYYPSIRDARSCWPDALPEDYGVEPLQGQLLRLDPPAARLPYSLEVAHYLIHLRLRAVRDLQRQGTPLLPPYEPSPDSIAYLHPDSSAYDTEH